MRIRFQADADLDGRVIRGVKRLASGIDFRTAADAGLEGNDEPDGFERIVLGARGAGRREQRHQYESIPIPHCRIPLTSKT